MSARSNRRSRAIEPLIFFLSLLIDGALAGALYALIALAFVLVYKSSRVVNFALGEWIMTGATLAAAGMAIFGVAFNAIVVRRLLARPAISLIMVTISEIAGRASRRRTTIALKATPNIAMPAAASVAPVMIHSPSAKLTTREDL